MASSHYFTQETLHHLVEKTIRDVESVTVVLEVAIRHGKPTEKLCERLRQSTTVLGALVNESQKLSDRQRMGHAA